MTATLRMLGVVMRHEFRVLVADRSFPLVAGLLVLLLAYGFHNGLAATQTRDDMVATVLKAEADIARANLDSLQRIEAGLLQPGPFDNPANPGVISNGAGRYAVLASLALGPVAIGQSDMAPNYYRMSARSKVEFMYDSEIESPWTLLAGHFDVAFVIVFLLPLLIFALTFNLLSGEREAGTQRMLLSQPLGLGTLVLGKLLPRVAVLLVPASLLPLILVLIFRTEARDADQIAAHMIWMGLVVAYGAFWFTLAFAVNALRLSSWANALALIASWTILILVIPVLLGLTAEQLRAAPSRTELSIQTRAIQAENLRRYDDLFSGDYRYIDEPETLLAKEGRFDIPPRTLASFLARRDMDNRLDELLDNFDQNLLEQQAIVDRFAFLSPAILMYEALTSLGGTDAKRYLAFRQQVSDFHDAWRLHFEPLIINGIALDQSDLRNLPRWEWVEPSADDTRHRAIWRFLSMIAGTALVTLLGVRALSRYSAA